MQPNQLIEAYGVSSNSQLKAFAETTGLVVNEINYAEDISIDRGGAYIINLGDVERQGTHWTALWIEDREAFYFDSFGVGPEDVLVEKMRQYGIHTWWYNRGYEFQRYEEELCGLWVLMLFHFMRINTDLTIVERFKKMAERYSDTL